MREILPGIFTWSSFSQEKNLDFNGLYVDRGGERMLVDPPPLSLDDETEIEGRGSPSTIVVTNRHHVRSSTSCRTRFGARILLPAADALLVDLTADGLYAPGDHLSCGFVAVEVPHSKSPGESALYNAEMEVLILGDALIGNPPGELSFLPPSKFEDMEEARSGIRSLMGLKFGAVLVGDGVSILSGAKEAIRRALERT